MFNFYSSETPIGQKFKTIEETEALFKTFDKPRQPLVGVVYVDGEIVGCRQCKTMRETLTFENDRPHKAFITFDKLYRIQDGDEIVEWRVMKPGATEMWNFMDRIMRGKITRNDVKKHTSSLGDSMLTQMRNKKRRNK